MKVLGPYRKGKKAFKRNLQSKASIRYILLRARKREIQYARFLIAQAAVITLQSVTQIAIIQSKPIPKYESGTDRQIAIAETIINTSEALKNLFK